MPAYRRVIVKVSGEAFSGPNDFGIHAPTIEAIVSDLKAARALGITIAVVVGGGNLIRGAEEAGAWLSRPTADAMGMMGTVMNALVLEAALERAAVPARAMSALSMPQVCETYERQRALRHLEDNRVVVFAGGTGNPFFTTDTTAVLRAAEMDCDAVLKATNVDGVYSADPKKDPAATRYDRLTHEEAIRRELKVMDATAFALARENRMPIIVFHEWHQREEGSASPGKVMAAPTHNLDDIKRRMQGALTSLKTELSGLRTGRASTSLVEHVQVDAYGTHMPLNQLATVSVPEPRMLSVQVWDRSMVHAVEKGISAANLGLTPNTEGQVIRLRVPELNEERRKELVKVAHKYAEAARVAVRHVRRDAMDVLKKLEKDLKTMSEDEHKRQSELVQKTTDQAISDVDGALAGKEKEIMTV